MYIDYNIHMVFTRHSDALYVFSHKISTILSFLKKIQPYIKIISLFVKSIFKNVLTTNYSSLWCVDYLQNYSRLIRRLYFSAANSLLRHYLRIRNNCLFNIATSYWHLLWSLLKRYEWQTASTVLVLQSLSN